MTNQESITHVIVNTNSGDADFYDNVYDAAEHILTYDGQRYEIRRDADGFTLYTASLSRPEMRESVVYSLEDDEDAARLEIFEKVCAGFSGVFGDDDATMCMSYASYVDQFCGDEDDA